VYCACHTAGYRYAYAWRRAQTEGSWQSRRSAVHDGQAFQSKILRVYVCACQCEAPVIDRRLCVCVTARGSFLPWSLIATTAALFVALASAHAAVHLLQLSLRSFYSNAWLFRLSLIEHSVPCLSDCQITTVVPFVQDVTVHQDGSLSRHLDLSPCIGPRPKHNNDHAPSCPYYDRMPVWSESM
jgi:hypothetical protein